MPEHLRALAVILVIAWAVFAAARAPACSLAIAPGDFVRRRSLWFALTLAVFLAHNFWIYIAVAAALLLAAVPHERNRLALFFFLMLAVPAIPEKIPGLGLIQHFITVNHIRLLALLVLLPAFIHLRRQPDTGPFGRSLPDKLIAAYLVLYFFLQMSADTFTNTLRVGIFYAFTDTFLPYYVASRLLRNLDQFRDALMSFVAAALVLGAIGVFETGKHWLLYASLDDALDATWDAGTYVMRGNDLLRGQASAGHPIVLGYVMAVALGFFLYLRKSVPNAFAWKIGLLALLAGLIAPLSRGPWMGAGAAVLVFLATSRVTLFRLAVLGLLGAVLVPLALSSGDLAAYVPLGKSVDEGSVLYRQKLFESGFAEVMKNPFFGGFDRHSPAMQELITGEGIIDIVNSYLGVALTSGFAGLAIFCSFFLAVAAGIANALRNLSDPEGELFLLGRALLATLTGILVTIFTVSSISVIPLVYWSVAGLGIAYARMAAGARARAPAPLAAARRVASGAGA